MANPKKSDVRQHETFPGTGPNGARSGHASDGASGLHPVEQMVDAAIDRLARDYQAAGAVPTHALAVRTPMHRAAGRLRWKGIDVTDEFREYAERVAQGEDLPPYAGKILVEPHPSFPWEPGARRKASRRAAGVQVALWCSALTILGLIVWSLAVKFSAPQSSAAAPLAQRSPAETVPARPRPALPKASALAPLETKPFETTGSLPEATLAPASAVELGSEPTRGAPTPAASAALPQPAPRANPFRSAQRPAATYSAPTTSTSTSRPAADDLVPAGSLREALGALLSARGAPNELEPPSTATASVQSSAATTRPAAAPVESANAGPVGKEPGGTASGKGSMLVETPSF